MLDASSESAAAILKARKRRLADGRAHVAALHRGGALGRQVCSALCDLSDRIITSVFREAIERLDASERPVVIKNLAVAAVGGYGRGDLAPFSDIDLLFLVAPRGNPVIRKFVSGLVRDLWDLGLKLSQSVRSPAECVAMARQDLPARTALGEARLLDGNAALFADMQRRVHRLFGKASLERFFKEMLSERAKEHEDYWAATVCLLEPNVKKSPGGLRDLHMLRWVALARYATADAEMLRLGGMLGERDAELLADASEYLLRLRHEMHFYAGNAQDVLTREEQVRLAGWLGYRDDGPVLAVERFMQHYYLRTTQLHDVVMRFVDRARRRSPLAGLLGRLAHRRLGEFHLARDGIGIDPAERGTVLASPQRMLRLFDLARRRGLPVRHDDLESIRAAAPACVVTAEDRHRFLDLLNEPAGIGGFLRDLHRVGLLGRLIPPFEHARCLTQFNLLHKYTVDEHTLLAVERAAARAGARGPLGQAYREIRRKDLLHLALLCHDLGKGLGEDHCEVGRRIAGQIAAEFGLTPHESELLILLVHQHLLMAQTAFRRDIGDERTLVQFTRAVATPETLRMLFVLTAADTEAVAPGNWTAWKESLLTELYARAIEELSGGNPASGSSEFALKRRRELVDALHIHFPLNWLEEQLSVMPESYLRRAEPDLVREHLRMLLDLRPGDVLAGCDYLPVLGMTQLNVVTRDDLTPGIFSKIAGVLAASGFEILSAQIITRPDGTLIDTFQAVDTDFSGEPPPARRRQIAEAVRDVLLGRTAVDALFRGRQVSAPPPVARRQAPPQVEIDNESSDRFTIIDVFADDRHGLLYDITRTLFELGLSVFSARISTHVDQVVDAFYVRTRDGRKIGDESAFHVIRARLLGVLMRSAEGTISRQG